MFVCLFVLFKTSALLLNSTCKEIDVHHGTICGEKKRNCSSAFVVRFKINNMSILYSSTLRVPTGSPSRGGGVAVYVFDINQPSLSTPFHSVLVSVSVFMALSTVFHSMNSPDNSTLSHSVLPALFLSYWSFQL